VALLLAAPLLLAGPAAHAADGSIDHVEPGDDSFQVLFSLPGAGATEPDLESVSVSLDGEVLPATAEPAAEAEAVERTTILAMDVSSSMRRDDRFTEAQAAAKAFLAAAPEDLRVGIVTFAGDVEVAQEPTLDREASAAVIDGLTLSNQTRLYDGVLAACWCSPTAVTPPRPRSRRSPPPSSSPRSRSTWSRSHSPPRTPRSSPSSPTPAAAR
jgi:tight adherence protein B